MGSKYLVILILSEREGEAVGVTRKLMGNWLKILLVEESVEFCCRDGEKCGDGRDALFGEVLVEEKFVGEGCWDWIGFEMVERKLRYRRVNLGFLLFALEDIKSILSVGRKDENLARGNLSHGVCGSIW